MSRTARTLVVLVALALTTAGLTGTARAVTAANGRPCTIVGTNRSETLRGTPGNDVICGLDGNDDIYGLGGNDYLDGGRGSDWLWGGSGTDAMSGGPDWDTVWYDDHRNPLKIALNGKPESGQGGEHDTISQTVENAVGGPKDDLIVGSAAANLLGGEGGNDTIDGGGGHDDMYGGAGFDTVTYASRTRPIQASKDDRANDGELNEGDNVRSDVDRILGGRSNDTLVGSKYGEVLMGNGGNDVLKGLGGPDYLFGGAGVDTADYSDHTANINVTLDGYVNDGSTGEGDGLETDIENVTGGRGNDTIRGDSGPNVLVGGPGNDSLVGYGGNDTLNGEGGNDRMDGGDGDDHLRGHAGDDYLAGGVGRDVLSGFTGADTLLGGDGNDRLVLDDAGADSVDGGTGSNACGPTPLLPAVRTGCTVLTATLVDGNAERSLLVAHVVDEDGTPIAGALGRYGFEESTPGQDVGSFGIFGAGVRLEVVAPGLLPGREITAVTQVFHDSPADADVTFTFPKPRSFTVHVVDTEGAVVQGSSVRAVPGAAAATISGSSGALPAAPINGAGDELTGQTDSDGDITFSTLASTLTGLSATGDVPGYGYVTTELAGVSVPPGGVLNVVVDRHPAHVTGTVSSPAGPLVGVKVQQASGPFSDYSDTNGAFAFDAARVRTNLLLEVPQQEAMPGELSMWSDGVVDFRPADVDLVAALPAMRVLNVHVVDQQGAPVAGAAVSATGQSDVTVPGLGSFRTLWSKVAATTGSSGVALVPVYDGYVTLAATWSAPGAGTRESVASVSLDASTSTLTVVMNTQTVLVSGVLTARASPVAGAHADLSRFATGQSARDATTTGADGAWTLHGPPGDNLITFSGQDLPGLPHSFSLTRSLPRQGSPTFDLPVRDVTVIVKDQAGAPVPGCTVVASSAEMRFALGAVQVIGQQSPTASAGVATGTDGTVVLKAVTGTLFLVQAALGSRSGQVTDVVVGTTDLSITITISG